MICTKSMKTVNGFYRTHVRSLATLVAHRLTLSLNLCRLVNLIDVTLAFEDANNLLKLILLVMLMLTV